LVLAGFYRSDLMVLGVFSWSEDQGNHLKPANTRYFFFFFLLFHKNVNNVYRIPVGISEDLL